MLAVWDTMLDHQGMVRTLRQRTCTCLCRLRCSRKVWRSCGASLCWTRPHWRSGGGGTGAEAPERRSSCTPSSSGASYRQAITTFACPQQTPNCSVMRHALLDPNGVMSEADCMLQRGMPVCACRVRRRSERKQAAAPRRLEMWWRAGRRPSPAPCSLGLSKACRPCKLIACASASEPANCLCRLHSKMCACKYSTKTIGLLVRLQKPCAGNPTPPLWRWCRHCRSGSHPALMGRRAR